MAPVSDGREKAPEDVSAQGPEVPSAHRRPGYSSSGCTPAEPDSASPGSSYSTLAQGAVQRMGGGVTRSGFQRRSEEHTSELQSRFGISYAVFCLKKKK